MTLEESLIEKEYHMLALCRSITIENAIVMITYEKSIPKYLKIFWPAIYNDITPPLKMGLSSIERTIIEFGRNAIGYGQIWILVSNGVITKILDSTYSQIKL